MKLAHLLFSRAPVALLVIAVMQVSPIGIVSASQPHGEEVASHELAGEHHAPGLDLLLFPAINFGIYLFIVVRFVIPAMREYLRRRHSELLQSQTDSSTALARAQQELAASKARFLRLAEEAEGIRSDLVTIATRQAERLKGQAEETGARRLADASVLAEQERRRAMAGLRRELTNAASRIAEDRVRSALTPDDQRSFIQRFLTEASSQ